MCGKCFAENDPGVILQVILFLRFNKARARVQVNIDQSSFHYCFFAQQ